MGRCGQRTATVSWRSRAGKLRSDPIIQRQALEIPPATLFAFQILLGTVFGIWGLALALPLIAIVKVIIDHFKSDQASLEPA
jgi:predicted PurR-regulated permease PerM